MSRATLRTGMAERLVGCVGGAPPPRVKKVSMFGSASSSRCKWTGGWSSTSLEVMDRSGPTWISSPASSMRQSCPPSMRSLATITTSTGSSVRTVCSVNCVRSAAPVLGSIRRRATCSARWSG